MEDKISVDKLTSSNYSTWKFKFKHYLIARDLFGYVDGSTTEPIESADPDVKAKYAKGLKKAVALIVLSVSDELLYLITEHDEDPKAAWDALSSHFERDTLANKMYLKKRYFRSVMSNTTSVEQHLKYMKDLTNQLAAIKAPISEEDQVVTLLGSLPDSYSTIVTALETQKEPPTLEFVRQALMNEAQKRREQLPASVGVSGVRSHADSDTALSAGAAAEGKPTRGCYRCGRYDHYLRSCPDNNNGGSRGSRGRGRGRSGKGRGGHNASTAYRSANSETESAFLAPHTDNDDVAPQLWIIDSGASCHMCSSKDDFAEYTVLEKAECVTIADGTKVQVVGKGSVKHRVKVGRDKQRNVTVNDVLHVPNLNANLFSVKAATQRGFVVQFGHTRCWLKDKYGIVHAMGTIKNKLYYLDMAISEHLACTAKADSVWHKRLAHACHSTIQSASNQALVEGADLSSVSVGLCDSCVKGKMSRKPFKSAGGIKSKRTLELVHTDVCGPMQVNSLGGCKYFVTFIDDFSRYADLYFVSNKSEVFSVFQQYKARVENHTGNSIGTLRSDGGGEYMSNEFQDYLRACGIKHQVTVRYTPQQNGCAERYNRTVCESARAMIFDANLPKSFWAEAVYTSVYVRNRLPTAALKNATPHQLWFGTKPDISHLRVFGSLAYAHIPDELRRKLDPKAEVMVFVGYSRQSKAYRLYDPASKQVVARRDVVFDESKLGLPKVDDKTVAEGFDISGKQSLELSLPDNSVSQDSSGPRRSMRDRHEPVRYGIHEYCSNVEHQALHVSEVIEPTTYKEAIAGPQATQWADAANEEYQSLIENETWELVPLPPGRKPVSCKWVFRVKSKADGTIDRYKARLVARGFSQQPGVDFDETYSPVVHKTSLRALLSYGLSRNMVIHQMDVVTAFLNGELSEDIYMSQPEGFISPGNLVCKLKRSLYGLKQSPRCWNTVLDTYLKSLGFHQSSADSCVYVRNHDNEQTLLAVYVDDIVLLSDSEKSMHDIKSALNQRFKMKDLGQLQYVLGISVTTRDDSLKLSQPQYVSQMLSKYGMTNCNPCSTPMATDVKLVKNDGSKAADKALYQSIVGSLLYLSTATRPDISYVVGVLSQFTSAPTQTHLTAAKRVLRFLKHTPELGIIYSKSESSSPVGYSDSSWADGEARHSTSGVVFMYGDGPVLWLSKRQSVVALSTAEAEYIASFDATREAAWLRQLYHDITNSDCSPLTLYIDNQSAICIANNTISSRRSRHMDVRYHYVREEVQNNHIQTVHCPTEQMIADILTKPLPRYRFDQLQAMLGVG